MKKDLKIDPKRPRIDVCYLRKSVATSLQLYSARRSKIKQKGIQLQVECVWANVNRNAYCCLVLNEIDEVFMNQGVSWVTLDVKILILIGMRLE